MFVWACTTKPDLATTKNDSDTTENRKVRVVTKDHQEPSHTLTQEFIRLVEKMDSLGFRSDTSRVKKLVYGSYLSPKNDSIVEGNVYYHINDPASTFLFRWDDGVQHPSDSLAIEWLSNATAIWAYFYCQEQHSALIEDGVIEQWEFPDEKTPQQIFDRLISFYPLPYFNTSPFYLISGKHLYVFHTRASAFSFRQQEFFRIFKKDIMREVPYRAYGEAD